MNKQKLKFFIIALIICAGIFSCAKKEDFEEETEKEPPQQNAADY